MNDAIVANSQYTRLDMSINERRRSVHGKSAEKHAGAGRNNFRSV